MRTPNKLEVAASKIVIVLLAIWFVFTLCRDAKANELGGEWMRVGKSTYVAPSLVVRHNGSVKAWIIRKHENTTEETFFVLDCDKHEASISYVAVRDAGGNLIYSDPIPRDLDEVDAEFSDAFDVACRIVELRDEQ
jgi:hypothetical protein